MITLSKSQVPLYLHDSAFYRNLSDDVDEEFSLGERHFKANPTVSDLDDLNLLLNTLRFWIADTYPQELLDYIWCADFTEYVSVFSGVWDHLSYLKVLAAIMRRTQETRLNGAIQARDTRLVRFMLTKGLQFDDSSPAFAVKNGDMELLQLVLSVSGSVGPSHCQDLAEVAAKYGQSTCLQYVENCCGYALNWQKCQQAVTSSTNAECFQYIWERCDRQWNSGIEILLAERGNLECLKLVFAHGLAMSDSTMQAAVEHDKLAVVIWLQVRGISLHTMLLHVAVKAGSEMVLWYLIEQFELININYCHLMEIAASPGYVECLQVLCEAFPDQMRVSVCNAAAESDNEYSLRFLHEHGCPWDTSTTDIAMLQRYQYCFKYAYANGCPVNWWKWYWTPSWPSRQPQPDKPKLYFSGHVL